MGGGRRGSIASFFRVESRWRQEGVVAGERKLMHNWFCPKERVKERTPGENLREGSTDPATYRDQIQPRLLKCRYSR